MEQNWSEKVCEKCNVFDSKTFLAQIAGYLVLRRGGLGFPKEWSRGIHLLRETIPPRPPKNPAAPTGSQCCMDSSGGAGGWAQLEASSVAPFRLTRTKNWLVAAKDCTLWCQHCSKATFLEKKT